MHTFTVYTLILYMSSHVHAILSYTILFPILAHIHIHMNCMYVLCAVGNVQHIRRSSLPFVVLVRVPVLIVFSVFVLHDIQARYIYINTY